MDKAFKILLEQINSNLEILNKNDYKLYDSNDTEWFLQSVSYDSETDKLLFYCKDES